MVSYCQRIRFSKSIFSLASDWPHEGGTTINTKLLQGSLREFGLVDLLQMMELGAMTGAIHLQQATGRIGIVSFKDGKLAGCSALHAGALPLGDLLQQLGMATSPQVEYAFSR